MVLACAKAVDTAEMDVSGGSAFWFKVVGGCIKLPKLSAKY